MKNMKWITSLAVLGTAFSFGSAASAAEAAEVEVKLTIGKPEAVVSGQTLPVKSPVIVNGSTLVPLRVISAAFESDPLWIPDTQGIVLTFGDKTIELRIDSAVSTVNGATTPIPSAPKLIDGTTMVPVRFISETLGLDVNFQDAGGVQTIVIAGSLAAGEAAPQEDGPVIDGDEGKTKIGDSHWGWSMDYPSGLIQDDQTLSGDWIYFADANGEYGIDIEVDATQPKMKPSGLLPYLTEALYDGTILDKQLIEDEGVPYAKVVSRTSSNGYMEDRLYLKDGVLYWYTFEAFDEANYKNEAKMSVYRDLIDSFELTFDKTDEELKDISSVKDGYIQHSDDVYGISMELPAGWTVESATTGINFYAPEEDLSMYFTMNSLEKGDTLEAWAQRHEDRFTQELLPAYREIIDLPNTTVDGADALVRLWSESSGGDWTDTYDVYVIKGEYKYNFSFFYDKDNRKSYEDKIERIVKSIAIDERVAIDNFGTLDDEYGIDLSETKEIYNETYGYSMTIPAYWTEGYYNYDDSTLSYEFRGGTLSIGADEQSTFEEAVEAEEEFLDFYTENDDTYKIVENKTETFLGTQAKKTVVDADDEYSGEVRITTYIFEKNDVVFTIQIEENKSALTPENIQRMKDALASITFE